MTGFISKAKNKNAKKVKTLLSGININLVDSFPRSQSQQSVVVKKEAKIVKANKNIIGRMCKKNISPKAKTILRNFERKKVLKPLRRCYKLMIKILQN